jgi:predicted dehydrogenase
MSRRTNRRQFLKETAAAGLGFWVAGGIALRESRAANETVNIACVGIGGKGHSDSSDAAQFGNIVAICDVDDTFIAERKKDKRFDKAKVYHDYRKMFDEMGKEFDAVTVSTPDHHHAVAGLRAMKMGKHLYCQKPLTHTVYEARQMRETATKMKVATQMGNQGTAADGLRRAVELIQGGAIGAVREAHVWTNRPVWPQAPGVTKRPKEDPVPEWMHWEEFIGAAPMRPFSYAGQDPKRKDHHFAYHAFNWRGWWDFGTGALGDMACHTANMAFMALQLGYPSTILAESAELNPETYPAWARVTFQFPARDAKPPVKFVWYEGHKDGKTVLPSPELVKGARDLPDGAKGFSIYFKNDKWWFRKDNDKPKDASSGSFLIGEKATLFSPDDYGSESFIITTDNIEKVSGKPEKLPSNNGGDAGQKKEWIEAIKGGPKALSNFDYAAMLTETILLGNIAIKLGGQKLEWDGPNLKVTNVKEAEALINPPYRKGWELPA